MECNSFCFNYARINVKIRVEDVIIGFRVGDMLVFRIIIYQKKFLTSCIVISLVEKTK